MKLKVISENSHMSISELREQLKKEFPELSILWIAEHDSAVRLSDIEIKPEFRNQGIGTKIVDRIKEYARSVGKPLILSAQPQSGKKTALNRFYKRAGFKKPGNKKNYSYPMHTHIWHNNET